MASSIAQALFVAAQQARDAGISTAALFRNADVSFNLAGRVGTGAILAVFALGIILSSIWLACFSKPWKKDNVPKSFNKCTSWSCFVIIGGAVYCAHLALLIAYGQLAPALIVTQAILCGAFFVFWVAVLQHLLQRLNDIPLLDQGQEPAFLSRPIISQWLDHGVACLIPLPVGIALFAQLQSCFASINNLGLALERVSEKIVASPEVTDLLSVAPERLGQSALDTLQAWIESAINGVFHSDSTLALTRMALALILVPLALALELLVRIRLNAFIKHAQTYESKRIAEMNLPRLLRLPSLTSTAPLHWSPPAPRSTSAWSEDVAMTATEENGMPQVPAASLLRAPTVKTVSSKYSTCTSLPAGPRPMPQPNLARSVSKAPSYKTTSTATRSCAGCNVNMPTEASLLAFRRRHLLITLVLCALIMVYAGAEVVSALLGQTFRLLPLAIFALVCVCSQATSMIAARLVQKRKPKHLVIEKMGLAV